MRIHEISACPACGSTAWGVLDMGDDELRACVRCDLVFAPAYADADDIYVDGYLTGGTDFGLDLMSPAFQAYLAHASDRRLQILHKVVRPPGSLLDVGCGTGELLAAARDRGWAVTGCDPVDESASYASLVRGLDVRAALLEDAELPERSFSVVTATHVLEHMRDPLAFVEMVSRWVKPRGHLFVEVPNFRSFHRRGHGPKWPNLRPLEHVIHFTPQTLRSLLVKAGLEVEYIRAPSYLWRAQNLHQMAHDLGHLHLSEWFAHGARRAVEGDQTVLYPRLPAWWALRGIEWVHDRLHRGTVIVAIARVP